MIIYAIDDEKAPLFFLCEAIKAVCPDDELKSFSNYIDFLADFEKDMPSLAFLDIEMPGKNGLELAKEIKDIKEDINIVFVTAYSQFAVDAYNLHASSYILKPATKENVEKIITKIYGNKE